MPFGVGSAFTHFFPAPPVAVGRGFCARICEPFSGPEYPQGHEGRSKSLTSLINSFIHNFTNEIKTSIRLARMDEFVMSQMWGNVHIEGELKWKTGNSLLGRKRDTVAHKCPYCGA